MKTISNSSAAVSTTPCQNAGVPMMNSIILLGAPGKILQGDTVDIGADVYEFRDSTPPMGGTAGRTWVHNGANSAASRANLIKAINGDVDAALVNRTSHANTVPVFARAGTTLGTVDLLSTGRVGSGASPVTVADAAPSATAVACSRTVGSTGTDVWNATTMYGGNLAAPQLSGRAEVVITTNMITAGFVEIPFTFAPVIALVTCKGYPAFTDIWAWAGNIVTVTLAGGGHPALANGDRIEVLAFGDA